ncbi:MAG: hypothetical protein O3B70_09925 [Bacteroidetes bacterium]|nr:hypothetical protein [Bacteroidota bacterium]MDA0904639.1 hypothetical protein [Bacteroidota bacterium]MDA1243328.1 hypothetical protein [Bacteroidota bacterium]
MRPPKPAFALILLGLAIVLLGLTFKLNHWMGAESLFNAGMAGLVVGLLWWVAWVMGSRRGGRE